MATTALTAEPWAAAGSPRLRAGPLATVSLTAAVPLLAAAPRITTAAAAATARAVRRRRPPAFRSTSTSARHYPKTESDGMTRRVARVFA